MENCAYSTFWCGESSQDDDYTWSPLFEPESPTYAMSPSVSVQRIDAAESFTEEPAMYLQSVNSQARPYNLRSENYSFQMSNHVPPSSTSRRVSPINTTQFAKEGDGVVDSDPDFIQEEPKRTCQYFLFRNVIYVLPSFGSSEPDLEDHVTYPTIPPSQTSNSNSSIGTSADALVTIRSAFNPNLAMLLPLLRVQYRVLTWLHQHSKYVRSCAPLDQLARPSRALLDTGVPNRLAERVDRLICVNCALYSSLSNEGLETFSMIRYNLN